MESHLTLAGNATPFYGLWQRRSSAENTTQRSVPRCNTYHTMLRLWHAFIKGTTPLYNIPVFMAFSEKKERAQPQKNVHCPKNPQGGSKAPSPAVQEKRTARTFPLRPQAPPGSASGAQLQLPLGQVPGPTQGKHPYTRAHHRTQNHPYLLVFRVPQLAPYQKSRPKNSGSGIHLAA